MKLFWDEAIVVSGGSVGISQNGVFTYGYIAGQGGSPANGDSLKWIRQLKAGTYTIQFLCYLNSNQGKVDIALNGGSPVATFDTYAGSSGSTNIYQSVTGVTVGTDGEYVITSTVNGKNGSSSGYTIEGTCLSLIKTA